MKNKIICLLLVFMLLPFSSFAVSLEEATDTTVKKLSVETDVKTDVLRKYLDYGFINKEYNTSVASALQFGLLVPNGKFLNPKEENLTPLLNGFSLFSSSSKAYSVVSFNEDVSVNPDTLYIKDNEFVDADEIPSGAGWALVTKGNVARIVWDAEKASPKAIFSADIYLCNGEEFIFHNLKIYSFTSWNTYSKDKYYVVNTNDLGIVDEEYVNSELLDKRIFFIGEILKDGRVRFLNTNDKFVREDLTL